MPCEIIIFLLTKQNHFPDFLTSQTTQQMRHKNNITVIHSESRAANNTHIEGPKPIVVTFPKNVSIAAGSWGFCTQIMANRNTSPENNYKWTMLSITTWWLYWNNSFIEAHVPVHVAVCYYFERLNHSAEALVASTIKHLHRVWVFDCGNHQCLTKNSLSTWSSILQALKFYPW